MDGAGHQLKSKIAIVGRKWLNKSLNYTDSRALRANFGLKSDLGVGDNGGENFEKILNKFAPKILLRNKVIGIGMIGFIRDIWFSV